MGAEEGILDKRKLVLGKGVLRSWGAVVGRWGSPPRSPWGLTGAQSLLQQQHLVTERLDPIAPAPQLRHLFGLQLFRGHGQHCSYPGPSLTGPLERKRYLSGAGRGPVSSASVASRHLHSPAPASPGALAARESPASGHAHQVQPHELGPRRARDPSHCCPGPASTRPCSHPLTGHVEDAGTGRGLWGPLRASAPIGAQHQAGRAATGKTARRIEAAMRAESDAGPAFIHV